MKNNSKVTNKLQALQTFVFSRAGITLKFVARSESNALKRVDQVFYHHIDCQKFYKHESKNIRLPVRLDKITGVSRFAFDGYDFTYQQRAAQRRKQYINRNYEC